MSEWSAFILCVVRVVRGNVGWLVVRGVWFAVLVEVDCSVSPSLLPQGDSTPNCT